MTDKSTLHSHILGHFQLRNLSENNLDFDWWTTCSSWKCE